MIQMTAVTATAQQQLMHTLQAGMAIFIIHPILMVIGWMTIIIIFFITRII